MELSAPARRTLRRGVVYPSWLVLFALAVAFSLGLSIPVEYRYLPLVASIVVLGLPHGAVDHLAIPRTLGDSGSTGWLVRIGVLYLVAGGVYAVVWFVAPIFGLVFFVLLTWAHWGQGDLWPLVAVLDVGHLRTRAQRLVTLLVRGGPPMLVPLWFFPGRYRAVVGEIVGRFGVESAALDPLFRVEMRLVLVGGLAVISLGALAAGIVRGDDRRDAVLDAAAVGLLWWYFAAVPPVFAIGVYFTAWHSLRHVGRLAAVDPTARDALSRGRLRAALVRVGRDAAPLTVLSLVGFVGLSVAFPDPPSTLPEFVAAYLVFIAVLTLPHVVVVSAMDRIQTTL